MLSSDPNLTLLILGIIFPINSQLLFHFFAE